MKLDQIGDEQKTPLFLENNIIVIDSTPEQNYFHCNITNIIFIVVFTFC